MLLKFYLINGSVGGIEAMNCNLRDFQTNVINAALHSELETRKVRDKQPYHQLQSRFGFSVLVSLHEICLYI